MQSRSAWLFVTRLPIICRYTVSPAAFNRQPPNFQTADLTRSPNATKGGRLKMLNGARASITLFNALTWAMHYLRMLRGAKGQQDTKPKPKLCLCITHAAATSAACADPFC
jgi:hypothetical protein